MTRGHRSVSSRGLRAAVRALALNGALAAQAMGQTPARPHPAVPDTGAPAAGRRAGAGLPRTPADLLLDAGRWAEAEDAFYAQARIRPREPVARAALGRYLAMKGALVPGTILIEEAQKFGLDPVVARALLAPWRNVQRWRGALRPPLDSPIVTEVPREATALFRLPLAAGAMHRGPPRSSPDVVPRIIGADSAVAPGRIGTETVELLVPSYDVRTHAVTFHGDPRSALSAIGQRFPVLRDEHDIRVLLAPGRVLSIAPAMRELDARWWQLDLPHGFVVVR